MTSERTPNHVLQRTAPRVTLAAARHPGAFAHPAPATFPQPAHRAPPSLRFGSLGVMTTTAIQSIQHGIVGSSRGTVACVRRSESWCKGMSQFDSYLGRLISQYEEPLHAHFDGHRITHGSCGKSVVRGR